MEFTVRTTEDAYNLEASIRFIGEDLLVAIWGGDRPHIGATAVAQPRPSLRDPERTSATASVICLPGHKEDELAKKASEKIASAINVNVVVAAGIHWDGLTLEGIAKVVRNGDILIDCIISRIKALSRPSKIL